MGQRGPMKGRDPNSLTVLDLFAGAGGMALGFGASGTRCIGAVEVDTVAARSLAVMFGEERPVVMSGPEAGDMTQLRPNDILDRLPSPPDIIVGGPPCQGFSRIG